MNKHAPFDCSKCGLCCAVVPARILKAHGLPVRAEGVGCGHLQADNSCAIYETRPLICRVRKTYEALSETVPLSWTDYAGMARRACQEIQRQFGWKAPEGQTA